MNDIINQIRIKLNSHNFLRPKSHFLSSKLSRVFAFALVALGSMILSAACEAGALNLEDAVSENSDNTVDADEINNRGELMTLITLDRDELAPAGPDGPSVTPTHSDSVCHNAVYFNGECRDADFFEGLVPENATLEAVYGSMHEDEDPGVVLIQSYEDGVQIVSLLPSYVMYKVNTGYYYGNYEVDAIHSMSWYSAQQEHSCRFMPRKFPKFICTGTIIYPYQYE